MKQAFSDFRRKFEGAAGVGSFWDKTKEETPEDTARPSPERIVQCCGIDVEFPWNLYPPQRKYISELVNALVHGKHALLESPTGTGKTLCLLCGVLAWQRAVYEGKAPAPKPKPRPPPPAKGTKSTSTVPSFPEQYAEDPWKQLEAASSRNPTPAPAPPAPAPTEEAPADRSRRQKVQSKDGPTQVSVPTIYFTSRTHAQLRQVVSELKSTRYCKSFQSDFQLKVIVVGSRDHLCVNDELGTLKGSALNAACRGKTRNHECRYEGGLHSNFRPSYLTDPRDLEDFRALGRRANFCSYYAAKEKQEECNLVLLPYDYLVSPVLRKNLKFPLNGSVVIFDEGHNVERTAEDAGAFNLATNSMRLALEALTLYIEAAPGMDDKKHKDVPPPSRINDLFRVPIERLLNHVEEVDLLPPNEQNPHPYQIFSAEKLVQLLESFGFGSENLPVYEAISSRVAEWAMFEREQEASHHHDNNSHASPTSNAYARAVTEIAEALEIAFSPFLEEHRGWFRTYISLQSPPPQQQQQNRRHSLGAAASLPFRVLSLWCFSAGPIMRWLADSMAVHSLVLTSGTLAPLNGFAEAMGGYGQLKFESQLANSHVVPRERVGLKIVSHFQTAQQPFRFVYQKRGDVQMLTNLAKLIAHLGCATPGGVLVFFSSYSQMRAMHQQFQQVAEWQQLLRAKPVVEEPNSATSFETFLEEFQRRCTHTRQLPTGDWTGAVMLAVTRGRVSEGMNLADHLCRTVIMVGVPFPQLQDPKLRLKQSVLEKNFPGQRKGDVWYFQQATRAVNQAIGRVIRHAADFGLIVLVDSRYRDASYRAALSGWLQPSISLLDTDAVKCVAFAKSFFTRFLFPTPNIKDEEKELDKDEKKLKVKSESQRSTAEQAQTKMLPRQWRPAERAPEVPLHAAKTRLSGGVKRNAADLVGGGANTKRIARQQAIATMLGQQQTLLKPRTSIVSRMRENLLPPPPPHPSTNALETPSSDENRNNTELNREEEKVDRTRWPKKQFSKPSKSTSRLHPSVKGT